MKKIMNIVVAVNSKYINYLIVLLTSVFENNKNYLVHIFVLHNNLTDYDICLLDSYCKRYEAMISPIKIDSRLFENYPVNTRCTVETYFRLIGIELLPETLERALYLDIDIAVDGSLDQLYFDDFEDQYMIVCEEGSDFADNVTKNTEWNRDKDIKYFNAGVLLFNMKKLKQDYNFKIFDQNMKKFDYKLELQDQDLLNYLFGQQVKYASHRIYNKMIQYQEEGLDQYKLSGTVIYHYVADNKPWGSAYKTEFFNVWWKYAKLTPFYDKLCAEYICISNQKLSEVIKGYEGNRFYYNLCLKWLRTEDLTENINRFFKDNKYNTAAIYGMGDIGKILYAQLKLCDIIITFLCDKKRIVLEDIEPEINIYLPEEDWPDVDLLIVTPVAYYDTIKIETSHKGSFDIICVTELLNTD